LAFEKIDVTKEVDFSVLKEDWTRYKLSDGTMLRIRIINVKVVPAGFSDIGTPNFTGVSQNLVSAIVPKELLDKEGPVKDGPITPEDIQNGVDLDFEMMEKPRWQEYKTVDGWLVLMRPEVGKVVRLKYYNQFAEPVYWANIQPVFRTKKA
jgi:hypothetical protein